MDNGLANFSSPHLSQPHQLLGHPASSTARPQFWADPWDEAEQMLLPNLTDARFGGSNYTCASLEMSSTHRILMSFYAIVFIGGFFGNALIMLTVLTCSGMQTVTNRYILNLAIADECYLFGLPFLIFTMNMGSWIFGPTMCKIYMVSQSITQFTSSLFMLIMSADRYIAICHHIRSPKYRTPTVSRVSSVVAWLTSALLIWPIYQYASLIERHDGKFSCAVVWPDEDVYYGMSFTLYTLVFSFLLPLGFIVLFYGAVLLKLNRVSRRAQRGTKGSSRHRKVTRMVLTVITVYVICWSPYWLGQVALISATDRVCRPRLEIVIFLLCSCLGYLNSAMNPVLYAFLSESFRKSVLKTLGCWTWCGDRIGSGIGGTVQTNEKGGQQRGKNSGNGDKPCSAGGCFRRQQPTVCGVADRSGSGHSCDADGSGDCDSSGARKLNENGSGKSGKRGQARTSRSSETQMTMVTRCCNDGGSYLAEANTMTTVTGLSSRNPSPPAQQRSNNNVTTQQLLIATSASIARVASKTSAIVSADDNRMEDCNELLPLSSAGQ